MTTSASGARLQPAGISIDDLASLCTQRPVRLRVGRLLDGASDRPLRDGSPDTFRMKVWDKSSGAAVYDNQRRDAGDAAAETAIGGGSTVFTRSEVAGPRPGVLVVLCRTMKLDSNLCSTFTVYHSRGSR